MLEKFSICPKNDARLCPTQAGLLPRRPSSSTNISTVHQRPTNLESNLTKEITTSSLHWVWGKSYITRQKITQTSGVAMFTGTCEAILTAVSITYEPRMTGTWDTAWGVSARSKGTTAAVRQSTLVNIYTQCLFANCRSIIKAIKLSWNQSLNNIHITNNTISLRSANRNLLLITYSSTYHKF